MNTVADGPRDDVADDIVDDVNDATGDPADPVDDPTNPTDDPTDPTDDPTDPAPTFEPGVRYAIYDGVFDALPDFSTRAPTEVGVLPAIDISARVNGDHFAYAFDALFADDVEGAYTFFTTSDDGSRLLVDGIVVVGNDGLHGPVEQQSTVTLAVGVHALRVEYFEEEGGAVLTVEVQPPGGARGPLSSLLQDPDAPALPDPVTPTDPTDPTEPTEPVDPGPPPTREAFHFEDSLRGGSVGLVQGGTFSGDGWHIGADTDRITFEQIPRLEERQPRRQRQRDLRHVRGRLRHAGAHPLQPRAPPEQRQVRAAHLRPGRDRSRRRHQAHVEHVSRRCARRQQRLQLREAVLRRALQQRRRVHQLTLMRV